VTDAQLDADARCRSSASRNDRPAAPVCKHPEMCGENREHALAWLTQLEIATQPESCSKTQRTWL
jgi:uncharacterized protein